LKRRRATVALEAGGFSTIIARRSGRERAGKDERPTGKAAALAGVAKNGIGASPILQQSVQPAVARCRGETPAGDRPTRFCFIDALRGLAALGIALHHINLYGPLRETISRFAPLWVLWTDEACWIGVQIFFVISGFVIAYSLRAARMTPAFIGNFALRRSIRLDPSYLTVVVLVSAMHLLPRWTALPSPHESGVSLGQVLTHGVYLQNVLGYDNLSAGFWTLCVEMQFYLLFCLLLSVAQALVRWLPGRSDPTRGDAKGAIGWTTCLVFLPLAVASLWWFNLDHRYENWIIFFFSMFFLGSLVWWTLQGRQPGWMLWSYVLLIVARLTCVWGIEIAVALWAGITIYLVGRLGHLTDWLAWRPLQYLGRISYSLYLIHYPVSHVVVWVGHRLTGENPWAACGWTAVALVLSLLSAHVLNVLVEAPTARLAARLKPAPAESAQAPAQTGSHPSDPPAGDAAPLPAAQA
jgi:peptidoglycan/LPS O-acetylase OafA/YrhL